MKEKYYYMIAIFVTLVLVGVGVFWLGNQEASVKIGDTNIPLIQQKTELEKAYTPPVWIDDGDTQYVNTSKFYLRATKSSLQPTLEFQTYNYNGGMNMVILVDKDYVKPVKAEVSPHLVEFENSYTCPFEFNNTADHFWCYRNVCNPNNECHDYIVFEHDFDRGNAQTKTAYWDDVKTEWNDISGEFTQRKFDSFDMTTAYYKTFANINANQLYTARLTFQPTRFLWEDSKYWIVLYPDSYGSNYHQAFIDNNAFALDPWLPAWDTSMVAGYDFNESSGNLIDFVGSNDGVLTNNPAQGNTTGVNPNSYMFTQASSQKVTVPDASDLDFGTGDFSILMWITNAESSHNGYLHKGDSVGNPSYGQSIRSETNGYITYTGITGSQSCVGSTDTRGGGMHMVVITRDNTSTGGVQLYVDGSPEAACTHADDYSNALDLLIGDVTYGEYMWGIYDELYIWKGRRLTGAEITAMYNSGSGEFPSSDIVPTVEITFPLEIIYNNTITNMSYVETDADFCWYSTDLGTTNSSAVVGGNNFSLSAVVGWNNWTAYCNSSTDNVASDTTNFFIDKGVGSVLISPIDALQTTNQEVTFSWNATVSNTNLTNSTFYLWRSNGTFMTAVPNYTIAGTNETITLFSIQPGIPEGGFVWTAEVCGDDVACVRATNRTFTIHLTAPNITILNPSGNLGAVNNGTTLELNWSIFEGSVENLTTHITNCSYIYNSITTDLDATTCTVINETTFTYISGINNISMTVFDIFNFSANTSSSWLITLSELSQTFSNSTVEGSLETFSVRVSTDPSFTILTGSLLYNGTTYPGVLTDEGSDIYNATVDIAIPQIGDDVNVSFTWSFILNDSTVVEALTKNQTILNISIDDCTLNSEVLYNFTMEDEETQVIIDNPNITNTTANLNMQIFNWNGETQIAQYNNSFSKINPFGICINNNLTGGGGLKVDAEIEYSANLYATEFYHLQNESLNSSDFPTNITLRDLNDTNNQKFKITYKDGTFLPVSNALIEIQRKYISEGVFKTIEIPKTDSLGETVGNLQVDDVIYKFVVTKGGIILGTFSNSRVVCQNPTLEECKINLNSFTGSVPVTDFEKEIDLSYTLTNDRDTRETTLTFTVPSGTVSEYVLNVTKQDAIGTFACTDTVTSSAGILSCSVPASIGNSTVKASVYRDGVLIVQGDQSLQRTPSQIYGVVLVILGLFVMLTLVGAGMSDNPVFTVLFFLVGIILLFALNLVSNNGFIGGGATILWLVIAIILIIIKGSKRD